MADSLPPGHPDPMGDRANVIVVRENGTHELYRTGWAVGIDLDLLEGPTPVLAMLPGLRQDGWWLHDTVAQGGILLDLGRKVLLFFAWEGPSTGSPPPRGRFRADPSSVAGLGGPLAVRRLGRTA